MSKLLGRLVKPLVHVATSAVAVLTLSCAPLAGLVPAPVAGNASNVVRPHMTLDTASVKNAKEALAGKYVSDFTHTLVSSSVRWAKNDPAGKPSAHRSLQALGGVVNASWPAAGINLRGAPFNIGATDRATNGMALRSPQTLYSKRCFMITQQGKFIDVDPTNPTVGYAMNTLAGTFTKTYITLTQDGSVAFVVSDTGTVYAINVGVTVAGTPNTHATRSLVLSGGGGANFCTGAALFADPMSTDLATGACTLHVVDGAGAAHRVVWGGAGGTVITAASFTAASFSEPFAKVALPTTAPATTATPFTGTQLVNSPPVVLDDVLVIGDRAGNVITYDYNTNTKKAYTANYGWPIETPCAIDCDTNLVLTDIFAAAGAQLAWVKLSSGAVYLGQYALVENAGNNALLDATNFPTYVNTTTGQLAADTDYKAFSSAVSATTNSVSLPLSANTPDSLDYNHLTHCGFLTGLPPTITAFVGKLNSKFQYYYPWDTGSNRPAFDASGGPTGTVNCNPPGVAPNYMVPNPVQDGQAVSNASLLSPSAIEFDDDGSFFVADTNHCQVLFTPSNATAWQRWFPTSTSVAPTTAYDSMADPSNRYNWLAGAKPNGNTTLTTGVWAAASGQPANSPPQSNFYVFAGTLYPNAPNNDGNWSGQDASDGDAAGRVRDVGNGAKRPGVAGGSALLQPAIAGAGVVARGTAVNRVQGLAVGNLGLYIANRNAFQSSATTVNREGQILFMPRNNLPAGTYYGITNPQPGNLYVICNFVDPQGIDVWRHPTVANRDIIFAPSMNSQAPSKNRVVKIDSTTALASITMANCTMANTTTLNDPYDVGLDDSGNLFIAEHGADQLRMISKAVSVAEGAPATTYNWGTAGVAGQVYTVGTGMQEISSVTFASADPQVPAGQRCLYVAMGGVPSSSPNRVIRIDQSLNHRAVAGPDYGYRTVTTAFTAADNLALGDAGDGGDGDAAAVRLSMPWRARGRLNTGNGNWETYICDRGNNRIRLISSAAGSSGANGYLCLPVPAAALGKPIYQSTLTCFAKATAGNVTPPTVALVPEKLKNGTVWSNATVAASPGTFLPMQAPSLDMINGPAFPIVPSTTAPWNVQIAVGGGAAPPYTAPDYQWRLPSQAIFTSATNASFQHVRIGMQTPTDTNFYFYPSSAGVITAPNVKSPDFYTNRGTPAPAANYWPRVDYKYGNRAIGPILSPPTIYYQNNDDTQPRYVYLMNANAIWRYNVTTPAAFISATNGAEVAFAKSAQGRDPTKGSVYPLGATQFQFNSTPPLVGFNGHIYSIDIWANALTSYTYYLNDFDGDLAANNSAMYVNGTQIATGVATSSLTDNSGIYMASDTYIMNAYFGLADGKIYCLDLNSTAP